MEWRREVSALGLLFLELGAEDAEHVVNGCFLKVGFVDEQLAGSAENTLGSDKPYVLELVNDPSVDFILESIKIDVLSERFFGVAVNVDNLSGKH